MAVPSSFYASVTPGIADQQPVSVAEEMGPDDELPTKGEGGMVEIPQTVRDRINYALNVANTVLQIGGSVPITLDPNLLAGLANTQYVSEADVSRILAQVDDAERDASAVEGSQIQETLGEGLAAATFIATNNLPAAAAVNSLVSARETTTPGDDDDKKYKNFLVASLGLTGVSPEILAHAEKAVQNAISMFNKTPTGDIDATHMNMGTLLTSQETPAESRPRQVGPDFAPVG